VKRAAVFIFFLLLVVCTVGVAAPTASPPPQTIARGVVVGGVKVGGLTSEPARALLRDASERPLLFLYGSRWWKVPPSQLDASFAVNQGVSRALAAEPGQRIRLDVRTPSPAVRKYAGWLTRRYSRPARDATLEGLVDGRPSITQSEWGVQVERHELEQAIAKRLNWNSRKLIQLPVEPVAPTVRSEDFGPVIVINRAANTLRLFDGSTPYRSFRVATGSAQYPTPSGTFSIVDMQRDPWWRPPDSDWAQGEQPIPPGPNNPLGTRWMGLSAPAVGIHGTPSPRSIGYSVSHGCIRMQIPDAEWLFTQVQLGTPVIIV
jgi:L,D-transpeptidase catalytic domain/Putative peptidoglycan binding domain